MCGEGGGGKGSVSEWREGGLGSDKASVFQDNVDSIQKKLKDHLGSAGGVASLLCAQLNHTLHLIGIMASWRNGFRITNKARLFQVGVASFCCCIHLCCCVIL